MNKYILAIILVVGLTGCNSEDVFPDGATYQTDTYEYFKGTGIWSSLEWDNVDFSCISNFVYDRTIPGVVVTDINNVDMECDPLLEYRVTVSKV